VKDLSLTLVVVPVEARFFTETDGVAVCMLTPGSSPDALLVSIKPLTTSSTTSPPVLYVCARGVSYMCILISLCTPRSVGARAHFCVRWKRRRLATSTETSPLLILHPTHGELTLSTNRNVAAPHLLG
jgi:hypothetical protein